MMNKFKMFYKLNPILNIMYKSLINLPTPSNISYLWNFGSLLGLCLLIQIFSGLFLSFHYMANINYTFNNIDHIYRNINYGWLIKLIHSNTASFFFICIYMHIGKNMYYGSYQLKMVWFSGIIILFLLMMTAFLGYVLPWGQMSFWGATVITNLLSTIPYLGIMLVNWIWGGFSISNAALVRFFSFHFIFPFIILAMVLIHLIFLHITGSNNPLGINSNLDKISFHNFFLLKDMLGYIIMIILLIYLLILHPFMFHDAENFIAANSLVTPIHIQPEWYFLFAYAILRSIPNKLGGVIALLMSILILGILPFLNKKKIQSNQFYPVNQMLFWIYFNSTILLTWIGMCPVEIPYILIGQILTILYFLLFFIISFFYKFWDKMLFN